MNRDKFAETFELITGVPFYDENFRGDKEGVICKAPEQKSGPKRTAACR